MELDPQLTDAAGQTESSAASYIRRERQKRELRGERDRLVLALAGEQGEEALAEQLGISAAAAGKLLAGARERMQTQRNTASGPEMSVRRLGAGSERWAEIDAHFATLGGAPSLGDLRPRSARRPGSRRPT